MDAKTNICCKIENVTLLDIESDFKEYLATKKTTSVYQYGSSYTGGVRYDSPSNQYESDDREVYFYEFSDLAKEPLKFTKVSQFIEWCKGYNIFISWYNESQMRKRAKSYCTCYTGTTTVLSKESYEELKRSFEYYSNYSPNYQRQNLAYGYCDSDYYWD